MELSSVLGRLTSYRKVYGDAQQMGVRSVDILSLAVA